MATRRTTRRTTGKPSRTPARTPARPRARAARPAQKQQKQQKQQARRVGYAVVGLGHIAQEAVLPAFAHAGKSSQLVALVSDDEDKRRKLARAYGLPRERTYTYEQYDQCLALEDVDAVYIALPNSMHAEYTERAARAGVHVLCEKPMATTPAEGERMIAACEEAGVKLMIGYRLHFEQANLEALRLVESGKLGDPRFFSSVFSYQVKGGNIRTQAELGGGALEDIGIYCINAARMLFRAEPEEVFAFSARSQDPRFAEIPEAVSALLRFPEERVAQFTVSFNAAATSTYRIVGTKGELMVDDAYEYTTGKEHWLTLKGKAQRRAFKAHDQFAAELIAFSDAVLNDRDPEPSGREGLADLRVIDTLRESMASGRPERLEREARAEPERRPEPEQEISVEPAEPPELVHADAPYQE